MNFRKISLNALFFDLDGTLVDSRTDIANAINFTLRRFGRKERSIQEVSGYIGRGVADLVRQSLGAESDDIFKEALSVFRAYFRGHATDTTILYPHVKDILDYFTAKRKFIVTNRDTAIARSTLSALGIGRYFIDVVGGDDAECMKPSSCPLDAVFGKFDLKRKETMIVGDMDVDVLAGKNAGIATCAVTYGIGKKEDIIKAHPDYIIDDLLTLQEIIT